MCIVNLRYTKDVGTTPDAMHICLQPVPTAFPILRAVYLHRVLTQVVTTMPRRRGCRLYIPTTVLTRLIPCFAASPQGHRNTATSSSYHGGNSARKIEMRGRDSTHSTAAATSLHAGTELSLEECGSALSMLLLEITESVTHLGERSIMYPPTMSLICHLFEAR